MKHTIEYIENIVCEGEVIDTSDLHTKARCEPFVTIRQLIMSLAYISGHTEPVIGKYFDKDHATVHNSKKSIQNRYDTDKDFRNKYNTYLDLLKADDGLKLTYLNAVLVRLKQEVSELQDELNKIAI